MCVCVSVCLCLCVCVSVCVRTYLSAVLCSSPACLLCCLQDLDTIGTLEITYTDPVTTLCDAGTHSFQITFHSELGDLPLIKIEDNQLTGGVRCVFCAAVVVLCAPRSPPLSAYRHCPSRSGRAWQPWGPPRTTFAPTAAFATNTPACASASRSGPVQTAPTARATVVTAVT